MPVSVLQSSSKKCKNKSHLETQLENCLCELKTHQIPTCFQCCFHRVFTRSSSLPFNNYWLIFLKGKEKRNEFHPLYYTNNISFSHNEIQTSFQEVPSPGSATQKTRPRGSAPPFSGPSLARVHAALAAACEPTVLRVLRQHNARKQSVPAFTSGINTHIHVNWGLHL